MSINFVTSTFTKRCAIAKKMPKINSEFEKYEILYGHPFENCLQLLATVALCKCACGYPVGKSC